MAEIGDPHRFHSAKAITAYAGLDTEPDDSGQIVNKGERHITKRGPAFLRKTLFMVMTTYLEIKPQEEPVYQFLDKKRSEGKMYYVYMIPAYGRYAASSLGNTAQRPPEGFVCNLCAVLPLLSFTDRSNTNINPHISHIYQPLPTSSHSCFDKYKHL